MCECVNVSVCASALVREYVSASVGVKVRLESVKPYEAVNMVCDLDLP